MVRSSFATTFTRTGKLDMTNRKPYRNAELTAAAKAESRIVNGRYVAPTVKRLFHAKAATSVL